MWSQRRRRKPNRSEGLKYNAMLILMLPGDPLHHEEPSDEYNTPKTSGPFYQTLSAASSAALLHSLNPGLSCRQPPIYAMAARQGQDKAEASFGTFTL